VSIHSRESATAKPGMTRSDRKWNTYYAPIIKRFELRETTVEGYPARIWVGRTPDLDLVARGEQSTPQSTSATADPEKSRSGPSQGN